MTKNVINSDWEVVTNVEDALSLVGGFGRFQWIASFICMGNYIRAAFFYYPLPYMELMPDYNCTSLASPIAYECEPADFCGNPDISYEVDWSHHKSLHNWVE